MKIGIAKERRPHETRVAASPDTVKKFVAMGLEVAIESGAGTNAAFTDAALEAAGAKIVKTAKDALGGADIVLKVRKPMDALELYHKEIVLEESEDKDIHQMKCLIIFYSSG